jgi:hypothetical protein
VLRRALTLLLLVAFAGLGCARTVVDRRFPALAERRAPILRIALLPLSATPEGAAYAAPVVARKLAEALVARGVEVVMPQDAARASGIGDANVAELAQAVKAQFGADALLLGEITRWVERDGSAAGSLRPASVGLELELFGAPDGQRLWKGDFDRTQQSFMENVLLTPRYPGGGTRWLTAEEFAGFAASELVAALPLAP